MVFEDGAIVDYISPDILRYRSGSQPRLSCRFPVVLDAASGEVRIDFNDLPGMKWDEPKVRPFSNTEQGDLRKRIERFVENEGSPFVFAPRVKSLE